MPYPFILGFFVQLWGASLRIDDKVGLCLIHLSIRGIPFWDGGVCIWGWELAPVLLGCCSVLLVLSCRVVSRLGLAIPSLLGSLYILTILGTGYPGEKFL